MPFLYHQVLECDSNGHKHVSTDHDITITIPKGAIAEGKMVHLEFGVTMYGPFNFPDNTRPISPIIWLCFMEEDVKIKQPFEIELPHIHKGLNNDNIKQYQVGFLKADHTGEMDMDKQKKFQFQRTGKHDIATFRSTRQQNYGVLQTNHCCYLCIGELDNMDVLANTDYCLARFTTKYSPLQQSTVVRYEFQFFATFDLPTCRKVIIQSS